MPSFNTHTQIRSASALGICLFLFAAAMSAQEPQALTTRVGLQDELARLERDPNSQSAAALIRNRLEVGDFQGGDRIVLRVEGEQALSDTFTVTDGLEVELPQVGTVSLRGVLRSELKDRMTTHLSQYIRDPVVEVRPLMRLLIEGQVARPGYYGVAPEQPLSDVFNIAGGLTQVAKVKDIRVERGETRIWTGTPLQEALGRGYSVDRLNIRAGDRVFVPGKADGEKTFRTLSLLLAIPATIFALTRAF